LGSVALVVYPVRLSLSWLISVIGMNYDQRQRPDSEVLFILTKSPRMLASHDGPYFLGFVCDAGHTSAPIAFPDWNSASRTSQKRR
jgi:hypothetical protein